jgi:hypothetical protein
MKLIRPSIFFILLVISAQVLGQTGFANKAELEKAANDLFVKKEYAKAKPLFSQLLSQDAVNADYNYRFGVCIMYTEPDPIKPIPYIEGGANSSGVNPEAFYFLGIIYRYNYRFDQSAEAFITAKKKGYTAIGVDLDRETQISRNGRVLFNDAIRFKPAMEKEVIATEFYRPYDFRKLKGKVIPTPPNFKSKQDEKVFPDGYVYIPSESQSLFYASYGEEVSNGKDIFHVKKLPNGEFGLSQRLPDVINTRFDEDFAFFDEENSTLYFSSKGHNTMGGYDVFSSRLDPKSGTWAVPVNLQFPINSPFDDYLYLLDPDGEVAFFTSRRGASEGMVRVFRTDLEQIEKSEVTVVAGKFNDVTDSLTNHMETTVYDPETGEVFGTYRSHSLTGKYVLLLPPKMGYKVDVAPRGASGFKCSLDVPKVDVYQTLQQRMDYSTLDGRANLLVTNYFSKSGVKDSVPVSVIRPLSEVKENMPELTPDMIAEVKARQKEQAEAAEARVLAQKKLEADKLRAEQEAKAAEQARLDSIAQAEALAAKQQEEERRKAEEQAKAAEQARLDSIAQAEALASKQQEEERRKAEEQTKAAEQARLDSIAQAEALAAKQQEEERRKAEEQAKAAERTRLDSIAQAEALASKQLEEERRKTEDQAKAVEQANVAEQARLDSIAQAEALAAKLLEQERRKAAEQAKASEQARLDSIAQAEASKQLEKERERLADIEKARVQARVDSVRQMKELADRKLKEAQLAPAQPVTSAVDEELRIAQQQAQAEELEMKRREQLVRQEAEVERRRLDSLMDTEALTLEADKRRMEDLKRKQAQEEERLREEQRLSLLALKEEEERSKQEKAEIQKRELAEAQRLAELEKEELRLKGEAKSGVKQLMTEAAQETVAVVKETPVKPEISSSGEPTGPDSSSAEMTDAELFRQTVARLEAQKKQQQERVKLKAAQEEAVKSEAAVAKQTAARESRERALEEARSSGDTVKLREAEKTIELAENEASRKADTSALVADLTSTADPAKYMAEMVEAEKRIEADRMAADKKDYTLRPMPAIQVPERPRSERETDPALVQSLERDRKAVEEHRQLAAQKEIELNERLRKDREAIGIADPAIAEELRKAEEAALAGTAKPSIGKGKMKEEMAAETAVAVPSAPAQVTSVDSVKAPVAPVRTVTPEVVAAPSDRKVGTDAVSKAEPAKQESTAPVRSEEILETVALPKPEPKVTAPAQEKAATVTEVKTPELEVPVTNQEPMFVQQPVVENVPMVNRAVHVNVEQEQAPKTVRQPVDYSGREAALRDYGKRSADFSAITDSDQRSLIQRMAAEDRGRLAVLKRLANAKASDPKSADKLENSPRTRDVIARSAVSVAREETVPTSFDRNDLRKRNGLDLRVAVVLGGFQLSDKVQEALDPAYLAQLQLPEFELLTDYQVTMVDIRRTRNHLLDLGFSDSSIAPTTEGVRLPMSDALQLPFVD